MQDPLAARYGRKAKHETVGLVSIWRATDARQEHGRARTYVHPRVLGPLLITSPAIQIFLELPHNPPAICETSLDMLIGYGGLGPTKSLSKSRVVGSKPDTFLR